MRPSANTTQGSWSEAYKIRSSHSVPLSEKPSVRAASPARQVHKINGHGQADILYQLSASERSTVQSFCAPI
jgi:hypothetical protein